MSELNEFLKLVAEGKKNTPSARLKNIEEQVKVNVKSDLSSLFSQLSSIKTPVEKLAEGIEVPASELQEVKEELVEVVKEEVEQLKEITLPTPIGKVPDEAQIPNIDKYLKPSKLINPEPALTNEYKQVTDKIKFLERWIGQIQNAGPGSGEVNFRYLDDVNRLTLSDSNDNWLLEYDVATKKVQFTEHLGPIRSVKYKLDGPQIELVPGQTAWNPAEDCLDVAHSDGTVLQSGLELHMRVRNETGSTLVNGTVVRFAGVYEENAHEPMVVPHIADGTIHGLYTVGVLTRDIQNNSTGRATWFGKVRDVNPSIIPAGETWVKGDLLYVHPSQPGKMTKVKPHAPNIVVNVAAVIHSSPDQLELLVRPTIYPRLYYGSFSDSLEQTVGVINTPHAVKNRMTELANGHHIANDTRCVAEVSGAYNYQFSLQIASTSASKKEIYIWARKNGVDVPRSATRLTITGNDEYRCPSWNFVLPMEANDYFELMWATSDLSVKIAAPGATAFCPEIPSSILTVTQVAL